jgi:hypothetical protein
MLFRKARVTLLAGALVMLLAGNAAAQMDKLPKPEQSRLTKLGLALDKAVAVFLEKGDLVKFEAAMNRLRDMGETLDRLRRVPSADKEAIRAMQVVYQDRLKEVLAKCEPKLLEVLADAKPPADKLGAGERTAFSKLLRDAWKEAYPEEVILGLRFPETNWERKKVLELNRAKESFDYVDRSVLLVKVIVEKNPKLAIMYTAFITKDNLSNTTSANVYAKEGYVVNFYLVRNVK